MRPAAVLAAVALVAGLTGCGSTTYDATIPTGTEPATTTTLPSGPASELLPRLVEEAGTLSGLITSKGDKTAVAEQIQSLWNASKQEVGANRPELLANFEANVQRCVSAARFTRAADADKAFRNLTALVDAYLGTP